MAKVRPKLAVALAMALVFALPACGSDESDSGVDTIKIGWQKVPMVAPNYLMAQEAAKYGLDIELVEFTRYTDMRIALENGSIDFGTFGPGDMALAADSGTSHVVALAGEATGADLIAKRAGMGPLTWADLASGDVSFGSFGAGIAWVKTVATLQEQGFDIGDVDEIKVAGTIFDVMQTLKSGGTEVAMNVDPAIAQAVQDGYAEYADELDINSSALGAQNSLFVANREMLDQPDVVKKVMENYVHQVDRLTSDHDLWIDTYAAYAGIERPVAEMSLERIELSTRFSQAELVAFAEFLTRNAVATNPDLPEIVEDSYEYGPLSEVTGASEEQLGKTG